MTSEILDQLFSKYVESSNCPTGAQIQRYLEGEEKHTELKNRVGFDIPASVLDGFTEKGVFNEERFTKFIASVGRFVDHRGADALGNLTTDFVRKNGSINENKFRRKMSKK